MALAVLDDLAALGAINYSQDVTSVIGRRGLWLIARASEQVVEYLGTTETAIAADTDTWTAQKLGILRAVITEAAASRLQMSTASPDNGVYPETYVTALLQPRHYRALDKLLGRAGTSSWSFAADRDENTSFLRPFDPDDSWA